MDVILDSVGAPYFKRNLESLNYDGRLFVIGTIGGAVTELDLRALFPKRLTVQGTTIFEIQYHILSFFGFGFSDENHSFLIECNRV